MSPKVSILIPCYNSERWIYEAIESSLNQTYSHTEVIVVDDGSTDNSLDVIKSFGDRIKWRTQKNQGGNVARNHLLKLSSGEWLQYLDSDDYLLPEKITEQIQFIQDFPEVDVVYSPSVFEYWDESQSTQEVLPIPEPHDPWSLLALWHLPQTGSPLWRRQALVDVAGWKEDQPCCQEHELYLRLLKQGKQFLYCDSSKSVYRQWSDTTVCKRDKGRTYRHRLEILDDLESYLKNTDQLNAQRSRAINEARFACARLIWLFDAHWAKNLIGQIQASGADFQLPAHLAPKSYRVIYENFGFNAAENIAKIKRQFTQVFSRN